MTKRRLVLHGDSVPESRETGSGPAGTEPARPVSPPGKPPQKRGDSSESREGLDRKAREDLDEHPRRHSGGSERRRRKRHHSHDDDAERGRRRDRSKHAERRRDREANREKESQPRSEQPPTDNRGMTYCSDCGGTVGGGQFGYANHCQGKYHRAAVYYWKGMPWPQAMARASKEWQRENDEYYNSCRQGQSRSRTRARPVALAERASSSARAQDRKEESRQRDAVKQQPAATKGAAPKKRSANAKASTENKDAHKKKEAQKDKKVKKEASSSSQYEEVT